MGHLAAQGLLKGRQTDFALRLTQEQSGQRGGSVINVKMESMDP